MHTQHFRFKQTQNDISIICNTTGATSVKIHFESYSVQLTKRIKGGGIITNTLFIICGMNRFSKIQTIHTRNCKRILEVIKKHFPL